MRQVTATEKLRAVNEGKMAKKEFVRQMRQQFPHFVSQYNGFDDTVQILKNKGMIFEAKVEEQTGQKSYDERPALNYSLESLERGIRIELEAKGITTYGGDIKAEDFYAAEKKAKDNLEKNPNHYLELMSGESKKVDKHDKEKEVKRGAADKDTFNDMKKATLKEEVEEDKYDREDDDGHIGTNTDADFEREQRAQLAARNEEMSEDAKKNLLGKVVGALRTKYPDITAGIVKDFIRTHYEDLLRGVDIEDEFEQYIQHNYDLMEKQGKDHDGDGDIDSDDYLAAKDKAIKKAMGKDEMKHPGHKSAKNQYAQRAKVSKPSAEEKERRAKEHQAFLKRLADKDKEIAARKQAQLKEAIKSIIKKTLVTEAATVKLADWAESYETFPGVKPVVNELENIVTEIESFYDKMSDKIAKVFEKTSGFENEEGLKIGGFIAPGLESAFKQDLSKVIKKGSFFSKIDLPKVRTITQADIDAHNSGERPLGEQEPEKATLFTPVNENVAEAQTDTLSDFGKNKLIPYLSKLGFNVKAQNGQIPREIHDVIYDKSDSKLAAVSYAADGKGGEYVYVVISKKNGGALDDVIKHFNLNTGGNKQVTQGWDTKDVKTASDNEITYQKEMNQGNMQLLLTRRGESSK